MHAGYSLNALVDFPTSDPIEIIKRLMIGSEGTFGFVAQATYNTVPEWPNKVWEGGLQEQSQVYWQLCCLVRWCFHEEPIHQGCVD